MYYAHVTSYPGLPPRLLRLRDKAWAGGLGTRLCTCTLYSGNTTNVVATLASCYVPEPKLDLIRTKMDIVVDGEYGLCLDVTEGEESVVEAVAFRLYHLL